MAGAPTDRDKLKTRYLAAEDDELVMLIEASRSTPLERAVAREVLIERGVTPPATGDVDGDEPPAASEPFRPVPSPEGPRDRAGDGRRIGLLLLGVGLLVTQGLRWWAREQESRAQWAETVRAAELSQGLQQTDVAALLEVRCVADPRECVVAGRAFELGDGVPADSVRALSYFDRACEGGAEDGCERARTLRDEVP
jgi:hypothetical protein